MGTNSEGAGQGGRKVSGWAAIAGLEAASRLFLQVLTTAVLARLLTPDDFGTTALVLTVVTIFNVFVAVPFEEPLSQRKHLRGIHVRTALAASWAMGLLFLALSVPVGWGLGQHYDLPQLALLLPAASLMLFPNVAVVMATAVARRRRAFNAIALSSLVGNVVGTVAAIGLGFLGAGLWALIAFRVAAIFAQAIVLVWLVGMSLKPAWSRRHYTDLAGFAWTILWDRLTDNLTYLLFNFMVASMFGIGVLGQFNMAMRVIEPVRGAVIAVSHNLSFALFLPAAHGAGGLGLLVRRFCARTALVTSPIFFGIAAVAPLLVPVLAGPGWEQAVLIAQILGIGGGLVTATQLVITALSALGRPQYSLWRGVTRLAVIVAALASIGPFGAVAVGLSRLAGDLTDTLGALVLARWRLAIPLRRLLGDLVRPLACSGLMAGAVALAGPLLHARLGEIGGLAAAVALGAVLYPALLALLDREGLSAVLAAVRRR